MCSVASNDIIAFLGVRAAIIFYEARIVTFVSAIWQYFFFQVSQFGPVVVPRQLIGKASFFWKVVKGNGH